jgi:transposase/Zn-finger protein
MITKKNEQSRKNIQMIDIDTLVPTNHLVRKIEKVIDFEFIREYVIDMYSLNKGRPSIDPVVLFKIVFIQFLFGIKSMRQTIKEINVNVAYRWFLGYGFTETIPNYSTFSQNYRRRFVGTDIFEKIFKHIFEGLVENGLIKEESYFVDSTHIKAYANKRRVDNAYIDVDYNIYTKNLHDEINKKRVKENKKPIDFNQKKKVAISRTDPDCGMFHKGEKEKQLAYSVQTAVDENGWVIDCKTTSASVNDNNSGMEFVDKLTDEHRETKHVVMDAGYTSPLLQDILLSKGIMPVIPYIKPKGKKLEKADGEIEFTYTKHYFKYNELEDFYVCPYLKLLTYRGIDTGGYRVYRSKTKDCRDCPYKHKCTNQNSKTITRHLLEYTKKRTTEFRLSDEGKELYRKRKYTIERLFAQCKMSHCLGFTLLKGQEKNHNRNLIVYSAANIKKLALLVWKHEIKITKISSLKLSFLTEIRRFFSKLSIKQKNNLVLR